MDTAQNQRHIIDRKETVSGEIQLQQRTLADGSIAFEIISDGVFLMASYNQTSERALAVQAIQALHSERRGELRMLVGGLGMGLTLQECLAQAADLDCSTDSIRVDVVELSPAIIEWNHTYLAPLNGHVLDHPSVHLYQTDLYDRLMASPASTYDAVILDVDNGPSWLAHEQNSRLYSTEALASWQKIVKQNGTLAIWSAQPEPDFLERMRAVFGNGAEVSVDTPHLREVAHSDFIYLASNRPGS